jgi:hypothetical protein
MRIFMLRTNPACFPPPHTSLSPLLHQSHLSWAQEEKEYIFHHGFCHPNNVCNELVKDCSFAALILLSWIECINDSSEEYEFAMFDLGINWRDVSIVNAAMKEAPSQAIVSEVPKRFILVCYSTMLSASASKVKHHWSPHQSQNLECQAPSPMSL